MKAIQLNIQTSIALTSDVFGKFVTTEPNYERRIFIIDVKKLQEAYLKRKSQQGIDAEDCPRRYSFWSQAKWYPWYKYRQVWRYVNLQDIKSVQSLKRNTSKKYCMIVTLLTSRNYFSLIRHLIPCASHKPNSLEPATGFNSFILNFFYPLANFLLICLFSYSITFTIFILFYSLGFRICKFIILVLLPFLSSVESYHVHLLSISIMLQWIIKWSHLKKKLKKS